MNIRQTQLNEEVEIAKLVEEAFALAQHRDGTEQILVRKLWHSQAFIPELSLLAEIDGKIVAYILFTRGQVNEHLVLVLAPLAVLPDYQGQGIGKQLILRGHEIARQMGYEYSLVLGDPAYYSQFDYQPADQFNILAPFEVERQYFMASKLNPSATPISGTVTYAEEFGI